MYKYYIHFHKLPMHLNLGTSLFGFALFIFAALMHALKEMIVGLSRGEVTGRFRAPTKIDPTSA